MALTKVWNADSVPVHLDADGHLLGAGEHGKANLADPVVAQAVAEGRLRVQEKPAEEPKAPKNPRKPQEPKAPKNPRKPQED